MKPGNPTTTANNFPTAVPLQTFIKMGTTEANNLCTDFFNEKISDKCKDYPLNEYDNELNKCSDGLIKSHPSGSIPENFINDYVNKVIQICTERENLENTFTNPDSIRYFT